jgi:hypothetical protein
MSSTYRCLQVLDYIQAERQDFRYAQTVDAEVDNEMNEILDFVEASEYEAEPDYDEIDDEMRQVIDAIEAEDYRRLAARTGSTQSLQKAYAYDPWANPFRNKESVLRGFA